MARILIVDDDPVTRAGLAEIIQDAGHDTIAVGTFEEGIAVLRTDPPDLLITDIRLEAFNGLQLVVSSSHHLPAIVITGYADPVLEADTRRLGAEYIVKPVNPRGLLALIEQKLAVARSGFHKQRRWERKQVHGLSAEIAGVPARIVDISYGGMRLEIEQPPYEKTGTQLTIRVPEAQVALQAELVWANLLHAEMWAWGAAIANGAPADWRHLVDRAP